MKIDGSIQYIESIKQAENCLERIQQFGDPIVAFDICPDLNPRSVPYRLFFCPSCPVVHYLSLNEVYPTHCECGANHFIEMAHVRLVIQGNIIVHREKS